MAACDPPFSEHRQLGIVVGLDFCISVPGLVEPEIFNYPITQLPNSLCLRVSVVK